MKAIRELIQSLLDKIWSAKLSEMNPYSAFFIKQLRIILIVSKGFARDKLPVQSAGLTFYTILSVVPIVALAFAIAKGFGLEKALNRELSEFLSGHQEVVEYIMLYANRMLDDTQGGLIAAVGVVILLWTVIRLLSNVEQAFNDIWQVAKGRSWIRKFTDYFSIMLMAPIFLVLAGSLTVVIATEIENLVSGVDLLQTIGPVIFFFVRLIPYTLIWLVFTMLYMVMPNTKVDFKSALIAGVIAGTAFQLLEWGYINFQVGVSRYNAIYGSFAALPLFMVWTNFSWLITLVGTEIAYANQYVENIELEMREDELSPADRKTLAIMISQRVFAAFDKGESAFSALELSQSLDIPFGLTSRILDQLIHANIIVELEHDDKEESKVQPARSVEHMTISDVLNALDGVGTTRELPLLQHSKASPYIAHLDGIRKSMRDSDGNALVKDLPPVIING